MRINEIFHLPEVSVWLDGFALIFALGLLGSADSAQSTWTQAAKVGSPQTVLVRTELLHEDAGNQFIGDITAAGSTTTAVEEIEKILSSGAILTAPEAVLPVERKILVVYAVQEDELTTEAIAYLVSKLRDELVKADGIINASAQLQDGTRHFNFKTEQNGQVAIQIIALSKDSFKSFNSIHEAVLQKLGFDPEAKEKQPVQILIVSQYYNGCGISQLSADSTKSPNNANNDPYRAALVSEQLGCVTAEVIAHELLHLAGAVQIELKDKSGRILVAGPPYSTGSGHCTLMFQMECYSDGPGVKTQLIYTDPAAAFKLDRGHPGATPNPTIPGDTGIDAVPIGSIYFNPHTAEDIPEGIYLKTHWNSADALILNDQESPTARVKLSSGETMLKNGTISMGGEATIETSITVTDGLQLLSLAYYLDAQQVLTTTSVQSGQWPTATVAGGTVMTVTTPFSVTEDFLGEHSISPQVVFSSIEQQQPITATFASLLVDGKYTLFFPAIFR
ncbi:hypothetical protein KA082_03245 [Candidatus Woesebacteria bacterium]|nr:hypothetical protein [Candidatus Woesebacteria bacterium]